MRVAVHRGGVHRQPTAWMAVLLHPEVEVGVVAVARVPDLRLEVPVLLGLDRVQTIEAVEGSGASRIAPEGRIKSACSISPARIASTARAPAMSASGS